MNSEFHVIDFRGSWVLGLRVGFGVTFGSWEFWGMFGRFILGYSEKTIVGKDDNRLLTSTDVKPKSSNISDKTVRTREDRPLSLPLVPTAPINLAHGG
jgi:hypothetical protein